ncbi:MAG: hypothetical protein AABY15_07115 [Nanoarchaeota archaeon]
MKINIAETTDNEIQEIIEKMSKIDAEYVDQGYVEMETPYEIGIGIALFPELLSYHDGKNWVTIPWICLKIDLDGEYAVNEDKQRELVKWLVKNLQSVELHPFKDEDSFAGYSSREQRKGYTIIKLYVNPSYPDGYWSNHAL